VPKREPNILIKLLEYDKKLSRLATKANNEANSSSRFATNLTVSAAAVRAIMPPGHGYAASFERPKFHSLSMAMLYDVPG
jgi:hypothetical protein